MNADDHMDSQAYTVAVLFAPRLAEIFALTDRKQLLTEVNITVSEMNFSGIELPNMFTRIIAMFRERDAALKAAEQA